MQIDKIELKLKTEKALFDLGVVERQKIGSAEKW
jgi:hypothetical protein